VVPQALQRGHPVGVGRVLDEFTRQVWLLTLDDLRHTPRVRAFMDHIAQAIAG